jgi:hypothetical protein
MNLQGFNDAKGLVTAKQLNGSALDWIGQQSRDWMEI